MTAGSFTRIPNGTPPRPGPQVPAPYRGSITKEKGLFFDFNQRAIRILKETGFHMAFVGQYDSDGYSTFSTDRFILRRKTIFNDDSLDTFISYLK